jgi:hypothetical protein
MEFVDIDSARESIQLNNTYYRKAPRPKVELTDRERELLDEHQEVFYCVCGASETEVKGQVMIACDVCDNWFHDECVGLTPLEASEVEIFLCPQCSEKPKTTKKRAKPSLSEIDILLGALETLDEEDRLKPKKKGLEPRAPRVAAYHLPMPTNSRPSVGIVGYLRNEFHPRPTLYNGFLVPVTCADIEAGYITTDWGNFRVAWQDGQIALSQDYSFRPDSIETDAQVKPSAPLGRLDVAKTDKTIKLKFDDLPELNLPVFKQSSLISLPQGLLNKALNGEARPKAIQKLMKERLKIKVSILSGLN